MKIQALETKIADLEKKVEQFAQVITNYGLAFPGLPKGTLPVIERLEELERDVSLLLKKNGLPTD